MKWGISTIRLANVSKMARELDMVVAGIVA
jgi:hypothetical protein